MNCSVCRQERKLCVLHYSDYYGYYVGTRCACGPYSRRSGFYQLHSSATAKMTGADTQNRTKFSASERRSQGEA